MTTLIIQVIGLIVYTAGLSALWYHIGNKAGHASGYDQGTKDNKATYENGRIRGRHEGETYQKEVHARKERERLRRDECGRFKKKY